jgi:hypothetical protein
MRKATDYPAQQWARMCEAAYMFGFVDSFDKADCLGNLHERLAARIAAGKVRKVQPPEGSPSNAAFYQIVK